MVSSPPSSYAGLVALTETLNQHIRQTRLHPGLGIEAAERAGRLLLLGQHPAPEIRDPHGLLQALTQAVAMVMPAVGLADSPWEGTDAIPIRIYLRLKTAQQPYAMHTFTWRLADGAPVMFPVSAALTQDWGHETGATVGGQDHQASPSVAAPTGADSNDFQGDASALLRVPVSVDFNDTLGESARSLSEHGSAEGFADDPAEGFADDSGDYDSELSPFEPEGDPLSETLRRWLVYYWSYGVAALILVASGVFAHALTRPCVMGRCPRIDQAETLYESAHMTLLTSPTGDDLRSAQTEIQEAISMLEPIPRWSGYYEVAQVGLGRYQGSIQSLNAVLHAQSLAAQAANLSQNPPHPVERWVNIHQLWQQAIARLESVPSDSPAFDYAQKKRHEYRENHSAIGRRIVAEEEAEANFNTAVQTGHLAQQRMDTANSLAGWQLVSKEWQAAIKGLTLVPQGTMVYPEAQAQLQDYQQQLMRATNQATLENAGARHYDRAIQAARAAAAYEANGQWTLAVTHWQQAVASAQQIPSGTILAAEAALLLESYQPALKNAQNRLRTAVAIQDLTTTLAELCAQEIAACTVREDPSQIQVTLASQYAEPLRQAITPPAADGTFTFTNELSATTQQLLERIITFSHRADRPIAIYDSRGGFVARYRPDLGGFVKN